MHYRSPSFVVVLILLSVFAVPAVTATTEYSISAAPSVETPDRTVDVEGTEYTVSSVGRVMPGDELRIETTAPDGVGYDVYIYNDDREIVDAKSAEGNDSVRFATGYLQAGSYVAAIYGPNGDIEVIQPVVVAGYDIGVDAPAETEAGQRLDVAVSLDRTSEGVALHGVEVVVMQDNSLVERVTADVDGETATATVDSLDAGEYDVYAVARNETEVRGQHELIGISDAASISVPSASNGSESTTDAPPTGGGSGGSGGDSASESTSTAAQTETTTTGTATPVETATTTETKSIETTTRPSQSTDPETTTATETTDGDVLTPAATSDRPPTTAVQSDGPWIGGILLLALTAMVVAAVRRP